MLPEAIHLINHFSIPIVYLQALLSSNEYAQLEGKKTIQPADVIAALKENEFEHFIPRLEAELKSSILSFRFNALHY